MSVGLAERDLAEGVVGEELLSALLLERLVPVQGRELEHALLAPAGQQAEHKGQKQDKKAAKRHMETS